MHAWELRDTPGPDFNEWSHRVWMEHVAFGMIMDGYQKMRSHVLPSVKITNTEDLLELGRQKRDTRYAINLVYRLNSRIFLPDARFDRPFSIHTLDRNYGTNRSYCLWCSYKHDGTIKPAVGKALEEVEDPARSLHNVPTAGTGKKLKLPTSRIPQTRYYCTHCNVSLCGSKRRGKRPCFIEFHSHIQN